MIGNPGAGKSTILNGLIGEVKFKSGYSKNGSGITSVLQEVMKNGCRYIDTPGLTDIEMRKRAAQEITAALKKGGRFRIFFMVTCESGRIKSEDATTMKLVLEAAKEIKNNYSIIVNKASHRVREDDLKVLLAKFNEGLPHPTLNIFANPKDRSIDDVDDKLPTLHPNLIKFIGTGPPVTILSENVIEIQADEFEKIQAELTKKIQLLEDDREYLLKRVKETDEKYAELAQQMAKQKEEADKERERISSYLAEEKQSRQELKEEFDIIKRGLEKQIETLQEEANSRTDQLKSLIAILEREVESVDESIDEEYKFFDSKKPCKYYKWGRCKRGGEVNNCPFRHDKKDRVCISFMKGYCKDGNECPFLHPV
eukprot:CAMPEP_0176437470 /NCGR_PEP_ID=MMETSP0127-20121128/18647_1 /TAXON_ID=938130 /ORGANISM="Platyophrya macrostoma, Strain WH" /LENGTH=368 /DNA_ID=CAMNT_0017821115 /DNA_START=175 /DNA_END=1281 /DNA_ORIENTATION=+